MNKLIKTSVLLGFFVLMGCTQEAVTSQKMSESDTQKAQSSNNPSPTDALKQIDKSLSDAGKITKASKVKFEVFDFDYKLPKSVSDVCQTEPKEGEVGCPEVQIQLAKSEPSFIADAVNRAVSNDDNPKKIKFRQSLDEFAYSQISDESVMSYYTHTSIERLPNHNNLVQIAIHHDVYLGGAHNMPSSTYLLFDMDLQSGIEFADLITTEENIYPLLQEAYIEYLMQTGITSDEELANHQDAWPLEVSQNIYFDEQGLVFVYDPYQLGPFVMGFIELKIGYDELNGMIKPKYL